MIRSTAFVAESGLYEENTAIEEANENSADARDAAEVEMEEADEALKDALELAGYAKEDAEEAATDAYASDADKKAISDAVAALDEVIAVNTLPEDATAAAKRAAAQSILDAVDALAEVIDAADVNSAAARAGAISQVTVTT